MKTSILVVDAQQIVRAGLCQLLALEESFEVLGDFADGTGAAVSAARRRPDVLLVEDRQSVLSSVDVIRQVREMSPETRCIVLTDAESTLDVQQAIVAGASGFLGKSASPSELVEAVRTVGSGGSYLSPAVTTQVMNAFRASADPAPGTHADLTRRQREVLRLIAEGLSTKEIAAELGISEKTAQTHRAKLMGRTGIRKASGLVRYAIREGLVSP